MALWLRLRAPFAAYRPLVAGVFRPTAPIITPSAAWGLCLNLAAIDVRAAGAGGATGCRADAPALGLAIGEVRPSGHSTLYQQLHSYPVGNSGKHLAERTHGAKFWIAPARRALLVGLDVVLGVEGEGSILQRIERGLRGEWNAERYGLPFAGDNNLLFDDIEVLKVPVESCWYTSVTLGAPPRPRSARLTVEIDRADSAKTRATVFAPAAGRTSQVPPEAWTWVPTAQSL